MKVERVEGQKAMLSQRLLGTNFMFPCVQADRSMTPIPVSGALRAGLERFSLGCHH